MSPSHIRLIVLIIATLGISLALGIHSGPPEIRRWTIKDGDLPTIKIAVFSDFHFSNQEDLELLATLKRQIINEDVDLILYAGDYIGSHSLYSTTTRDAVVKSLAALAFPKPAFAVLGNHDNWDSHEAWVRAFENSAINLIENRIARIKMSGRDFCIRGLGDIYSNHWEHVSVPSDCKQTITLTHDPAGLLTQSGDLETISFAGHTHCGQIAFPLIGAPIVPTRAPKDMHCGQFNRGRPGIVSGGFGTSIIPLRFGSSTEPGWELIKINADD